MLFKTPTLHPVEKSVIDRIDKLRATLGRHVKGSQRWAGLLRRTTFARNLRGSNSIEGFHVTADDAIAAVEGQQPLEAQVPLETWKAISGYRDALTYVMRLADDPHFVHGANLLRSLHYMMTQYDLRKNPGTWRPGIIYIRDDASGEVVYEGPDVELVPELVAELVTWLEKGDLDTPAMVRAGMAHLNLVMIHPYSDGNGRMARCLQTLVLAREGILDPVFCSIEEYLGANTPEYYRVLAEVGGGRWQPERDARPWIRFVLTGHYRQAATLLRRVRETQKMWDELEQLRTKHELPERMMCALNDACQGYGVRNATYRGPAEVSEHTASRDFLALVDAGLLVPKGEKRGRYYVAGRVLRKIRERVAEPGRINDPFEDPTDASAAAQPRL